MNTPQSTGSHETIPVNVNVSEAQRKRILRQTKAWTGPKLTLLLFISLAIALVGLYLMASTSDRIDAQEWTDAALQ